ncbi:hypothetical protein AAE478_007154 [Parahypoxylon ruwenzoriense]
MPKPRAHMRSSRRIPPLKDSEIDHEISLVDHTATGEDPRSLTPETVNNIERSTSNQPLVPPQIQEPLDHRPDAEDTQPSNDADTEVGPSGEQDTSRPSTGGGRASVAGKERNRPERKSGRTKRRTRSPKEPQTAIDILYENQRGGFLCGIPLFSSAALGNLDPPAWTNFAHKPSPTDVYTAQVPDPSWEWAWPEWRVNHDEAIETDGDGWEYSFMFSKKFSWHGPKWYNSFVRRRAWIRRRVKKGLGYLPNDSYLGPEYFSVTPSRSHHRSRSRDTNGTGQVSTSPPRSRASQESVRRSRDSRRDDKDEPKAKVDIATVHELMDILKRSRIDREKLEAMENYIEHSSDELQQLQDYMHEIMSIFVFQASRKLLLARLIQLHDDEVAEQEKQAQHKGKSPATPQKAENLAEAIKHADEEVRRLEYWSDIKGMAESGESRGAVDCGKGWDKGWEALDKSGPKGVRDEGELL